MRKKAPEKKIPVFTTPLRLVALGASNLTRGFHVIVSAARRAAGPDMQILAALGHGRSYGAGSRFLMRSLPSIRSCGIWAALQQQSPVPTRCLVTDVGNDLLYGFSSDQTLEWIEESVQRCKSVSRDIVLTGLPLHSIERLSNARFLFFRSLLVPSCRLSLVDLIDRAHAVNAGLEAMARRQGLRFVALRPEWYGIDPIHVRPRFWSEAWSEIAGLPVGGAVASRLEAMQMYLMAPERRMLFGRTFIHSQHGMRMRHGGRIWMY